MCREAAWPRSAIWFFHISPVRISGRSLSKPPCRAFGTWWIIFWGIMFVDEDASVGRYIGIDGECCMWDAFSASTLISSQKSGIGPFFELVRECRLRECWLVSVLSHTPKYRSENMSLTHCVPFREIKYKLTKRDVFAFLTEQVFCSEWTAHMQRGAIHWDVVDVSGRICVAEIYFSPLWKPGR